MADDDRAVMKTYVPPDQKEEWQTHAERLDMSQSEFLRTMVQAGRRGFLSHPEEGGSSGSNPRGDALEERVLDALSNGDALSWDELVAELSGDFEDRLDETIQSLDDAGEIQYAPREGGYVRQEGT
jgi:hypothetical protein